MGQIVRIGGGQVPDFPKQSILGNGKRALVLGGGGIAGASFHIGTLLALNDVLADFHTTDFDIYVGTSAGAFLCACLANGITPEELAKSQIGKEPPTVPAIRRKQILKPVRGRLARGATSSVGALRSTARQVVRNKGNSSWVDTFFSMTEGLGSWRLYTTKGVEEYLRDIFSAPGRTNNFETIGKELFITATDLDTARRTVFGDHDCPETTISQAVAASAAIPVIYEPVKISGREYLDGGLRSTTNLDVALAHGAGLVVLINPLVPYLHDARYLLRGFDSPLRHVSEGGLGRVVAQVFRIMAHAHLDKELDLLRLEYPDVDILVIEPHRNDEHLFVFNLMDYNAREQMARDAFEMVAVDLVTHFPDIERLFAAHGIEVEKEQLLEQLQLVLSGGTSTSLLRRQEALLREKAEEHAS
jgi:predicted acylesterase/phospholipase RssA